MAKPEDEGGQIGIHTAARTEMVKSCGISNPPYTPHVLGFRWHNLATHAVANLLLRNSSNGYYTALAGVANGVPGASKTLEALPVGLRMVIPTGSVGRLPWCYTY